MRFKSLNKLSQKGIDEILKSGEMVEEKEDAIIVRSADMHEVVLDETVLAVARAGAGVNNIPLEKFADKGVVVFNTPGANANAVKELTLCGMLLACRDVVGGVNWVRENKDLDGLSKAVEKNKSKFAGSELLQKNILVIGLGVIGVKVANACLDFGMNVFGYDPYINVNNALKLNAGVKYINKYDDILNSVDYISVHVPLNTATKKMINKDIFNNLKKGAVILNFSRGELVDEEDLKIALEEEIVSKYVTDFPNNVVANMKNVIAIPHLGASTEEAEDICAVMAVKQVKDYIMNGTIINSVNYPECVLDDKKTKNRIVVLFKNEEKVYDDIQKEFFGKEVKNVVMKTRGSYGYAAFDCNEEISICSVELVNGVIRVRKL